MAARRRFVRGSEDAVKRRTDAIGWNLVAFSEEGDVRLGGNALARISHTRWGLRRFKKPTGQKPRAARSGCIGQARRRTLSASSTGPSGCLSAGISNVGRLNRMPRYAFRRPTSYLPRRKRNAGPMECENCGLADRIDRRCRNAACLDRLPGQQAQVFAKPPGDHLHTDRNGPDETGGDGEARKPHGGNAPLSQLCLPHAAEGGFSVEVEPVGRSEE